jgi:3-dehydroquinate dehydratase-1
MLIAVSLDDKQYTLNLKKAKTLGADAVEYRIDSFENLSLEHCKNVLRYGKELNLVGILTVRDPKEGGKRKIENRLEYYEHLTPLVDFVDIELNAPELERETVKTFVRENKKKLILSYHDFEKTPPEEEIEKIFQKMVAAGADVAKVSFYAHELEDVSRLLCVARSQPIPTVSIAMGAKGKISRVAGFAFNSIISYCALDKAFAPGQLTLKEMVELKKLFFEE